MNIEEIEKAIEDKTTYSVIELDDKSNNFDISDCYLKSISFIREANEIPKLCVSYKKYDTDEVQRMIFNMDDSDFDNKKFDNAIVEMGKKFKIKN